MAALNRSAAWQALQARDFFNEAGGREVPPMGKLQAAFHAAVALGLLVDDYRDKLEWLATVHDCTYRARSPAGALAWRTSAGKLWWGGQISFDWAKQLLKPPPPDDAIVHATAAALKRPEDA